MIRYDLTSHGLTGPDPSGDYSRARGAQLLNGCSITRVSRAPSIAGSSTGGALAWYYAAHFPERGRQAYSHQRPGPAWHHQQIWRWRCPTGSAMSFTCCPSVYSSRFLQAAVADKNWSPTNRYEFHQMYRRRGNRMAEFERMRAWECGRYQPDLRHHAPR